MKLRGRGMVRSMSRRELMLLGITASFGAIAGRVTSAQPALSQNQTGESVKALTFDIFGTVVDWRGSIIREGELLSETHSFSVNWGEFADQWRGGYGPLISKVRTGELPWTNIDDIHRMRLDELIREFGLTGLSEIEKENFNKAWHRLTPWPDAVGGLSRLKEKFIIATLSNGNISLLTNMAKNAGLPWDVVLSAELAERYKPDPEAYLTAVDLLDLEPQEVMMVATHPSDLRAAARVGLRTAYVIRPLERGPNPTIDTSVAGDFDYTATDFFDLAVQLGV